MPRVQYDDDFIVLHGGEWGGEDGDAEDEGDQKNELTHGSM